MREGEMKLKREREKRQKRRVEELFSLNQKNQIQKFREVMLTILTNNPFRDPSVDRLMSILKGKLNIGEN